MSDALSIYQLLKNDPRYTIEAYQFVRDGLGFATGELRLGNAATDQVSKPQDASESHTKSAADKKVGKKKLPPGETVDKQAVAGKTTRKTASKKLTPPENAGSPAADSENETAKPDPAAGKSNRDPLEDDPLVERHLTGQQLCEAIRQYALLQYGYMAKSVLNAWGIQSTSDFGSIVYNMIDIGLMKKSDDDRREHFDNVYDFQKALVEEFEIKR